MTEVEFRPIEEGSHVMTLDEFRKAAEIHAYIDYDGYGHLATETEVSNVETWPSKFLKTEEKDLPKWATHIVWYNR